MTNKRNLKSLGAGCVLFVGSACGQLLDPVPDVTAARETAEVESVGDAADDPAIWINEANPAASRILGTDKQSGLHVYDLGGESVQFLPTGKVNNVDLRQGVALGANGSDQIGTPWAGDVAVASNRSDNTVAVYDIDADGIVSQIGSFASALVEPYGICLGVTDGNVIAFVTYKSGDLIAYRLTGPSSAVVDGQIKLDSQLEGCVYDDETEMLYVGEEEKGIWTSVYRAGEFTTPVLVDEVDAASGIRADVEGLAIYRDPNGPDFLIASSQGNNSFAVYALESGEFLGRFRLAEGDAIDGAEDTDGIEATSVALSEAFPRGVLVVQDGFNKPKGSPQNFKIIDWREIEGVLASAAAE
ncbi:MAG: phytase [Pseudomonadota bacterium]